MGCIVIFGCTGSLEDSEKWLYCQVSGKIKNELATTAKNNCTAAMELPEILQKYPGNKTMQGLLERMINEIPPHEYYWELFAGSASLYRRKKLAKFSRLVELDAVVAGALDSIVRVGDVVLPHSVFDIKGQLFSVGSKDNVFVYADPPYPIGYRRSRRRLYRHEMTDAQHEKFLIEFALECPVPMMISTNPNPIYEFFLNSCGWRKIEMEVSYRGQPGVEVFWMNYPEPKELHEYTYLGADCWERQQIKRKIGRRVKGIERMPDLERLALLEQLRERYFK